MTKASRIDLDDQIEAVRRFNRFYTRKIGVLREGLLNSRFSLTEVRVLYEIASRDKPTATELREELGLDPGYLSRILGGLEKRGLVRRAPSEADARQVLLALTKRGHKEFAELNARSNNEIGAMLEQLPANGRPRLVMAMDTILGLLRGRDELARAEPYLLRSHRPGDMGWIVHRHGVLYSEEYGYDEQFEALVAGIVAEFIQRFDPHRDRCWIAEKDGEIVGSVFVVKKTKIVAKLRLLYIEPKARGLGIGKRLVSECVRFARQVGYKKLVLWTQKSLLAARHVYREAGFSLMGEEPHHSWGQDLVAETWEMDLK
jgi:DNA-binding MarR family transcriptional regulator/N-acetylglutamate synthase-like GNAT family acetyltransferase